MHRQQVARSQPAIELAQILLGRVAGGVDGGHIVIDDMHALAQQMLLDVCQCLFVAGNQAGREDHGITGFQGQLRVIARRQPAQRGRRFALAAGADPQLLITR